jgi:hypothetical protein
MALPRTLAGGVTKFISIRRDSEGDACGWNFETEKAAQWIATQLAQSRPAPTDEAETSGELDEDIKEVKSCLDYLYNNYSTFGVADRGLAALKRLACHPEPRAEASREQNEMAGYQSCGPDGPEGHDVIAIRPAPTDEKALRAALFSAYWQGAGDESNTDELAERCINELLAALLAREAPKDESKEGGA